MGVGLLLSREEVTSKQLIQLISVFFMISSVYSCCVNWVTRMISIFIQYAQKNFTVIK